MHVNLLDFSFVSLVLYYLAYNLHFNLYKIISVILTTGLKPPGLALLSLYYTYMSNGHNNVKLSLSLHRKIILTACILPVASPYQFRCKFY